MLRFGLGIVLQFVTVFVVIFLVVCEVIVDFKIVLEFGVVVEVRDILVFTDVVRFGLSDLKVELALLIGFRFMLEFRWLLVLEISVGFEVIVEIVSKM